MTSLHSVTGGFRPSAACCCKPRTALPLPPVPIQHVHHPMPVLHSCARRLRSSLRASSSSSSSSSSPSTQTPQPRQAPGPPKSSDDEPSVSGSAEAPEASSEAQEPSKPWLVEFLLRVKAPKWLISFISTYLFPPANTRTAHFARALWVTLGFLTVALGRELVFPTQRVTAREVLYSDLVTLLDAGRVRAARLEAGTSRLYFDITTPTPATATTPASPARSQQQQQQAAAGVAEGAQAAESTTAAGTAVVAATAAASPAAAAAAPAKASAAARAAVAVRHRFQKQFYVKLADKHDPLLVGRLLQADVEFAVLRASFQSAAANAFLTAIALWVPLLPMLWLLRRIIDQRQGTGRAKKSSSSANTPSTTFADVAGVDAAKAELLEVVSVMRRTRGAYSKLKVKMPSGVLLCGPPGTGKTLLAKAVAGEAGVPFFAVSASEFVELFVGRGAARIRELFAEARKAAPCVVFVDELDGVGSRRGMGYNDERDQTLNQLLTELDGFDGRAGVLFLAATNRIDVLDPALLRPGRISRKVVVPLPDAPGRAQILAVHLRGVPLEAGLEPETCCTAVAAGTEGFSGAELANVVNEASMLAAREAREEVGLRDLLAGAQRTRFGVNGRSGASGFGGTLTQRLQKWLLDTAAAAATAERRPVKVRTGA